jgi:adenosylcobyric acid synthase
MINCTDFDWLAEEEDVALRDAATPGDLAGVDVIALPGTKNTVEDLRYVGQAGFTEAIRERVARRREVVGICGSYQMLGRSVADPDGAESGGIAEGFGLLNVTTRLLTNKITRLVEADPLHFDVETSSSGRGYFIHMGETPRGDARPCFHVRSARGVSDQQARTCAVSTDDAVSAGGMVRGTYIHGLFDRAGFRRAWLNRIRLRRRLPPVDIERSERFTHRLRKELDR